MVRHERHHGFSLQLVFVGYLACFVLFSASCRIFIERCAGGFLSLLTAKMDTLSNCLGMDFVNTFHSYDKWS